MITKTIVSRQASGGVSITYYDDRDDLNEIIRKQVTGAGNVVIQIVDGLVEVPASKADRDCWDYSGGKIVVDAGKKAAKESKKARKQSVLAKLKITEEDLADLLKR
jgi:hypothetical protein